MTDGNCLYTGKRRPIIPVSALLLICLSLFLSASAQSDSQWLKWSKPLKLPVASGLSSAVAGFSNNVLIVGGGSNFTKPIVEGGIKQYHDSVFVSVNLQNDKWIYAGRFPYAIADAAVVPYKDGLLCIGGTDGHKVFSNSYFLRWNQNERKLEIDSLLPKLPVALYGHSAAVIGNTVFVATGKGADQKENDLFLSIDLSDDKRAARKWKKLSSLPATPRYGAALISQTNGESSAIYLFGGKSQSTYLKDAYEYDLRSQSWKRIADLPRPALLAGIGKTGHSHILLFSGSDGHDVDRAIRLQDQYKMVSDVLAYHTITDTWIPVGQMQHGVAAASVVSFNGQYFVVGGELRPGVRHNSIQIGSVNFHSGKASFGWIDYLTLVLYLVVLSLISYYFSKRKVSSHDYLLGGQRIPFWAAGISVMATQVSAIGFMSIPGKAYAVNWAYFAGVFTWFIAVPIVTRAYIPFIRKMKIVSAYEYLEVRFNSGTRLFAATIFVLFQLARMGLVLYLPALALSAVTPLDTITSIIIMGVLSTFYTVLGGIEAVIWIEVIQAILLFGGAVICVLLAVSGTEGGFAEVISVGYADGKFSLGELNLDFTSSTLVVILLGNVFNRIGNLTADQAVVQRYMTTPTTKAAKKSVWADVAVSIPWAIVIYFLGTALYVFYKKNPELINPSLGIDATLPFFIAQQAPSGLSGLIIAGIFAASMSTLEGSIHSVATIYTKDFYGKFRGGLTEKETYKTAQLATFILGCMATGIALLLVFLDINSILDVFQELTGLFIGASAGLFMLGIFSVRANGTGALIGAFSSGIILYFIKSYTPVSFWVYSGIGFVSCIVIGYVCSLFIRGKKQVQGLTFYTIQEAIEPKNKEQ